MAQNSQQKQGKLSPEKIIDNSDFTLNLHLVDEVIGKEDIKKSMVNKARIKKYELLQKALENDEEINVDD
eukprot:CAMPEP_0116929912 /NCGR_PEP_ID=MMETSP0467-20121206/26869_1 /TAXON_ID=283647 /ORGANISM="Mesodinium pulex, Strain SPMC105" /LENGTH=69 /DNA_ID=CAMNT_0004609983 /DNA_START=1067 /DNA_END=1276 /DNA_ORIENTATION=-